MLIVLLLLLVEVVLASNIVHLCFGVERGSHRIDLDALWLPMASGELHLPWIKLIFYLQEVAGRVAIRI